MLKPIRHSKWSPALAAGQKMMRTFALWLCDPRVKKTDIIQANLIKALGTPIEGQWLWAFLKHDVRRTPLLDRAGTVANLSHTEKRLLHTWILRTADVSNHFSLTPNAQPLPVGIPLQDKAGWAAFKTLMEAFYSPGLTVDGLPYDAKGNVTSDPSIQVDYKRFKRDFLLEHKIDKNADAREACVICGAELCKSHIDHWISKAKFPLLSVCADNLIPMCDECNESPNKGSEDVHTGGSFSDWFHPYRRHPTGTFTLKLSTPEFGVELKSSDPADAQRLKNLDELFNLKLRWSKELRAEYRKVQRLLERRQKGKPVALTLIEVYTAINEWAQDLSSAEPNHEVHKVLFDALTEPCRLVAWHAELEANFP